VLGLAFGLGGIAVLVNPSSLIGQPIHLPGAIAILVSCFSWAIGSLYARRAPLPKSVFLATGMELFAGGVLLLIASAVRGEWAAFDIHIVSFASAASMLYLLFFGSIIAFSAYVWLLNTVSPAAVSTYAFVNPAVALVLGWMFGGESLGLRAILAAGLIISAVILITIRRPIARTATSIGKNPVPRQTAAHAALEIEEPCEV
jgi:drug/metabolite transporter (DMT)-like permease